MYSSTSAFPSKWSTCGRAPELRAVTLGREDQIRCCTPAAADTSAMLRPWVTSVLLEEVSQTNGLADLGGGPLVAA